MAEPVFYRDIEEAEHRVLDLRADYLRRWGWTQTCNTPGAYWLWRRDFVVEDAGRFQRWHDSGPGPLGWPSQPKPYGIITASLELAVSMTARELDLQPENEGDEDDG